jgi:hypothetical protein
MISVVVLGGEPNDINLEWITSLPVSLGFSTFAGHPIRRSQGFAAPLFPQTVKHTVDHAS